MGLAKIERANAAIGKGCLGKAADDEPVFILRAQDALAADAVDHWANHAQLLGVHPDKVREARELADAMREWPNQKNPD
jgi:hypothetical protein